MVHGDAEPRESSSRPEAHGSNRSQAWLQLTYDYLRYLRGQLDEVTDLLEAEDFLGIGDIAHRGKGTSGTYRLLSIAEKFAQLEQAAGRLTREDIPEVVLVLRQLIEAEIDGLRRRIAPAPHDQSGGIDG